MLSRTPLLTFTYSYVSAVFSNHVHSGAGVYGRVLAHAVRRRRMQAWAGSEGGRRAEGEEQGVITRAEGTSSAGVGQAIRRSRFS